MAAVDVSLFKPELVFLDADVSSRDELFEHLAEVLTGRGYVAEGWLDAIRAREEAYPTGLACQELNVAIPHVDPEIILKPYIAVIRPSAPVEFEHMARISGPVAAELVVNLGLLRHADDQVVVLQALMDIFMSDEAVEAILAQDTPEGMVSTMATLCAGPRVRRVEHGELALSECRDGNVAFAFTERTGGVSHEPYASLNLGAHVGDDPQAVAENRRRVLEAMGCEGSLERLLVPNQIHGDHVTVVESGEEDALVRAREEIAAGADAIVCTASHVPVMLCYADCVPVVLTAPGGFAVIHSGWKGTYARISAKAAAKLSKATGCPMTDIRAYIGPHIQKPAYEVSDDLMEKFDEEFDWHEMGKTRNLDMTRAIIQSLVEAGIDPVKIEDTRLCTVVNNDRFFSYRAENGACGRHAAVAVLSE